jgi:hypothetical protein
MCTKRCAASKGMRLIRCESSVLVEQMMQALPVDCVSVGWQLANAILTKRRKVKKDERQKMKYSKWRVAPVGACTLAKVEAEEKSVLWVVVRVDRKCLEWKTV